LPTNIFFKSLTSSGFQQVGILDLMSGYTLIIAFGTMGPLIWFCYFLY